MDELLFFFLSFSAVKVEVKKNKSKGIEVRNKKRDPVALGVTVSGLVSWRNSKNEQEPKPNRDYFVAPKY